MAKKTSKAVPETEMLGKWSAHINLPFTLCPEQLHEVAKCQKHCKAIFARWKSSCQERQALGFQEVSNLHVSISRPFCLEYIQIEPFLKHLSSGICNTQRFPICLELAKYCVLLNESRSNAFMGLQVAQETTMRLNQLVYAVNISLAAFCQKPFFSQPLFHVSLASVDALRDGEMQCEELQQALNQVLGKRGRTNLIANIAEPSSSALCQLVGEYGGGDDDEDQQSSANDGGILCNEDKNSHYHYECNSEVDLGDEHDDTVLFIDTIEVRIGDRCYAYTLPSNASHLSSATALETASVQRFKDVNLFTRISTSSNKM